jgi:hypothetical protein
VTVTVIGDAGLAGSISAMVANCLELDGGQVSISGSFSASSCPGLDLQFQNCPSGC